MRYLARLPRPVSDFIIHVLTPTIARRWFRTDSYSTFLHRVWQAL